MTTHRPTLRIHIRAVRPQPARRLTFGWLSAATTSAIVFLLAGGTWTHLWTFGDTSPRPAYTALAAFIGACLTALAVAQHRLRLFTTTRGLTPVELSVITAALAWHRAQLPATHPEELNLESAVHQLRRTIRDEPEAGVHPDFVAVHDRVFRTRR